MQLVKRRKRRFKTISGACHKNIGKIEAQGTITSEGFIVLKGSQISPVDDSTVPDTIKEQRRTSNIVDGILQDDMLFQVHQVLRCLLLVKVIMD